VGSSRRSSRAGSASFDRSSPRAQTAECLTNGSLSKRASSTRCGIAPAVAEISESHGGVAAHDRVATESGFVAKFGNQRVDVRGRLQRADAH
jgi:hypothetical protein